MRSICTVLAGVAALSLGTSASAQWGRDRTYSHQLRVQIDAGVREGTISPSERIVLGKSLGRLAQLERQFMPNGISGREYAVLFRRSAALAKDVAIASRGDDQVLAWKSEIINGQWVPDARFAGLQPGDRFDGDARVGEHTTTRIVRMPAQYRNQYVDSLQIYYGYDDGRVYQIDRKSQMILALLDMLR